MDNQKKDARNDGQQAVEADQKSFKPQKRATNQKPIQGEEVKAGTGNFGADLDESMQSINQNAADLQANTTAALAKSKADKEAADKGQN